MQIIVGGRFDYIQMAWSNALAKKKIFYFENETRRPITKRDRIRRKLHSLLDKSNLVRKEKLENWKVLDNLNEYFDVYSLKRNKQTILVLYEMNVLSTDFESLKVLKRFFKKIQIVFFFSNVIGSVRQKLTENVLENRNLYDLIYTFNPLDGAKYNLHTFAKGVFPYNTIDLVKDKRYETDVFWIGKNKGRLPRLKQIKALLESRGLKVEFIVIEESVSDNNDGIMIKKDMAKYNEVSKYIFNTKALLDLPWEGAHSLRYTEAIAYSKWLVVDADNISNDGGCVRLTDFNSDTIKKLPKWDYTSDQITTEKFIEEVVSMLRFS